MSTSIQRRHPTVTAVGDEPAPLPEHPQPQTAPQLTIGEIHDGAAIPTRGGGAQLEPTLAKLDRAGLSVEVRGAPAAAVRQWVQAWRKKRGLPEGSFRVLDRGDHVGIWRLA